MSDKTVKKEKPNRRPTIKDIAREANTSFSTVSLVLRDPKTTRVSQTTRNKIQKIAKKLNYRPNLTARTLVGKNSSTIGLVVTTLQNPFYAEITQAIIDRAMQSNFSVIASSIGNGGLDAENHYINALIDRKVDGLIICSSLCDDEIVKNMENENVPFVLAMRDVDQNILEQRIDFVGVDNHRGAVMAMDHLIEMGHSQIALISGPQNTSTGRDRLAGCLYALSKNGIELDNDLVYYGDYTRKCGYEKALKIIKNYPKVTAIFSANDIMAIGVLDALSAKGLKSPDDMALIGFDDIDMAGLPGIDLTTISQQKNLMGAKAVDLLLMKIKGKSNHVATKVYIDPILSIRKTCGYNLKNKSK